MCLQLNSSSAPNACTSHHLSKRQQVVRLRDVRPSLTPLLLSRTVSRSIQQEVLVAPPSKWVHKSPTSPLGQPPPWPSLHPSCLDHHCSPFPGLCTHPYRQCSLPQPALHMQLEGPWSTQGRSCLGPAQSPAVVPPPTRERTKPSHQGKDKALPVVSKCPHGPAVTS